MHCHRLPALLTAVALLSGCASYVSQSELRTTGYHKEAVIERNYQVAFQDVTQRLDECFPRGFWSSNPQLRVDGVVLNELGRAEVTGELTVVGYRLLADFDSLDDDRTKVSVWSNQVKDWRITANSVLQWARGIFDAPCGF